MRYLARTRKRFSIKTLLENDATTYYAQKDPYRQWEQQNRKQGEQISVMAA